MVVTAAAACLASLSDSVSQGLCLGHRLERRTPMAHWGFGPASILAGAAVGLVVGGTVAAPLLVASAARAGGAVARGPSMGMHSVAAVFVAMSVGL